MKEYIRMAGKTRGHIDTERKVYISHRTEKHLFRKFNGLGCSVKILDFLSEKGIGSIEIIFNLIKLECTVQDFYNFGEIYSDGKDEQLILNLNRFNNKGEVKVRQMALE